MNTILTGLLITCQIFVIITFFRIYMIKNEKLKILDIIKKQSIRDVLHGKHYIWRYNDYDTIKLSTMIFLFWIPVKNFYKDMNCIKPFEEIKIN